VNEFLTPEHVKQLLPQKLDRELQDLFEKQLLVTRHEYFLLTQEQMCQQHERVHMLHQ
jgi:hypothetical protein